MKMYGEIEVQLGSTLPQKGTVYYVVADTLTNKSFSFYTDMIDGKFSLKFIRFMLNFDKKV